MYISLWGFLSVGVVCGVLLLMFIIHQEYQRKAQESERVARKNEDRHFKADAD